MQPPVDGATRDEIVVAVIDDLHGYGMGIADLADPAVQGRRSAHGDAAGSPEGEARCPTRRPRPPATSCAIRRADQASGATSVRWLPTP